MELSVNSQVSVMKFLSFLVWETGITAEMNTGGCEASSRHGQWTSRFTAPKSG